ncbi:CAZyme family GH71 and CBM24 [Penicillium roqueforti]|uniref:Glycoside hydrolase, family 71 n=1 Tax=Penicillium roqueforti (strain FM164) TaxID=1365484 RepID=W6R3N3_PENRF|nr:CAZyme family GH71 and CBM24 [Penicillium roqueforti]CDM36417.1 Glycoside hydrolase, family 71 [Penicillium roqueforti FM164]KAF9241913.1 CAZyme family GH71 and CBM24 [Penicillium roqueforti]KAI1832745.1 CAZyme family GH71 and CBM24 [Penicillium roqueforti]KAI2679783.1 CAZyme family GH71 and CBM24 [Penicillium roqueforti]KAI2684302.1 CAZyme family GH71 and CBM24 [Penicillium roqueforti]
MVSLLAWATVLLLACRVQLQVQAAAVFAHFMVTNTANYTSNDWENDILLAQDAHIDAFALNMAYADSTNTGALAAAFSAADSLGFKLFFSFDYAGNGDWPKADVITLIQQYSAHSSYYFYKGQAFVSTFEGPGRADDWPEIKAVTGCFFIPSWSSLGAKPAVATGVVDGLFSWAGWPWGPQDADTYVDASYLQYLESLPYMMPVSPWFFTNLPGYKKNWMWRGDHLWHDRWQQVLYIQPEFVEIISWNDYGESHYIGPLYDQAMEAFEVGEAPFNYATEMPHDGWRATIPFWADMYKDGTAEVTEETIIAWYRLTPGAACDSGGTSGNTASQLQVEFPPAEIAQDRIFFSAVLGSFSGAVVSIGDWTQTVGWFDVPDDDVGVYYGDVAIGAHRGPVTVSLMRDNVIIATIEGKAISSTCEHGVQNWNAWVGSTSTGETVSARPTRLLSEQVCMNGTGANNFAGLCGFACRYGYCPLGACTCTRMGIGYEPPNSTGVLGYPIVGEGASYSGLCSFDCNLGFCPESACGTVEVPLSTPTVSPFLPPACVSGSGEGNLAGLCDFGCAHGFCPMNACTCTGQGALNVMDPTSETVGTAAPGVDATVYGPLCEYTCQRGYCPEGACIVAEDSDSGSGSGDGPGDGEVYIAPSIWNMPSPVVQCEPPCSLIMPPLQLASPSVISIPPWESPVEQSYLTTRTTTYDDGVVETYNGYAVATTTITISFPPSVVTEIPVWGVTINASQAQPTELEMTRSITLPYMVWSLPPFDEDPNATSMTGTVLPPPYPWSQASKDSELNTATTTWSSGSATPTADRGNPDVGVSCKPFCHLCLLCRPDWSGGGGGGSDDGSNSNSNSNSNEDECSTREAEICSTVCVAGSGCEFDCSTTTGCSVTASATSTVGTPAPAVAITLEQWPEATEEPDAEVTSIARSLDSRLSALYGDLTVLTGYEDGAATATATSTSRATTTTSAPPDLPTSLSDLQFVIFLRKPADSLDSWTWSGYLLPTYYDEEYVCNNAYEVVTSTDNIPNQTDEDSDYGYPMYLGPFAAQDLNCGYVSQGLTPGDVHCGTQVLTCLELDALHALGYPGYTCGNTEFYMQAWCPMAD